MLHKIGILCLLIFFGNFSQVALSQGVSLNLAPLEFSNRAACSALSTSPARSAFLFIDSFSAGKSAYSSGITLQRFTPNLDPNQYAIKGSRLFRLWNSYFAVKTLQKITSGKLPLFSPNNSEFWPEYAAANKACLNKNQMLACPEMNDLLGDIWARAHKKNPAWSDYGLTKLNFYPSSNTPKIGCHVVKKFSAFHSHLGTQKIENGTISNIAFAALNPETTLDSCYSYGSDDADPRFATIQIDISNLPDDKIWDKYGFAVWHTLKLYMAWGWRYDPEMQQKFAEFSPDFRNIALEDALMLIPNGCRSVDAPKCDDNGMAADAMRAAKVLGSSHIAITDLPQKPIDILYTRTNRQVNADELKLLSAENSDAWHRDFKVKLMDVRSEMISKFNIATAKMQMLTALLNTVALEQDLNKLSDPKANIDLNEAYLACSEYNLAENQFFKDISDEIKNLAGSKELDSLMLSGNENLIRSSVEIYVKLQKSMNNLCKALDNRKLLRNNTIGIKYALNEWAFVTLYPIERGQFKADYCIDNKAPGCPQNGASHYLTYQQEYAGAPLTDLCHTSLECARTILDSVVDIVSVRRYAQAFLPIKDIIQSPNLFNTYDMPKACGLYDPFFFKRRAWKLFVADLGSAAIMGASFGALNFKLLEPSSRSVRSFKEIHDEYMTKYEPEYIKNKAKWSASANLGFFTGVPCMISYSNAALGSSDIQKPDSFALFAGISVSTCKSKKTIDVRVTAVPAAGIVYPNTIDDNEYRACFYCGINVTTIGNSIGGISAVTGPISPAINAGIGLFQGLLRLFANLRDTENIPRLKELDVDVLTQYQGEHEGKLPKRCTYKLKRGHQCY